MGKSVLIGICAHLIDIYPHKEEYLGKFLQDPNLVFENHLCLYMNSLCCRTFPVCGKVSVKIFLFERGTINFVDVYSLSRNIPNDLIKCFWHATMGKSIGYILFPTNNEFRNISFTDILWFFNNDFFFHLFPEFLQFMKL